MGPAVDSTAGPPDPAAPAGPAAPPVLGSRFRAIRTALLALFGLLVAGLAYRQVGHAADYTARENRQSLRRVLVPAARGIIYDREHRVLAGNRVHVAAALNLGALREAYLPEPPVPPRPGQPAALSATSGAREAAVQRQLERVNALTGRHEQLDPARLERAFARERLTPFVLLDDLTEAESSRLAAGLAGSDPVQLVRTTERWYPHGRTAGHVLGTLRPELIRRAAGPGPITVALPGAAGDSGIEKQYDARLRGRPGETVVRVDAWGFPVGRSSVRRVSRPGEDVVLSLDLDLQLAAESALAATPGHPRGAAVALAVRSGEVLALASAPDFDLNAVSPRLSRATKQRVDAEGGWLNRATQGLYPPGSTFKIFTMLAGLRHQTLHPHDVLRCDGYLDVAGRRFPCHLAAGHGDLTLREALAHSCNVFAYRTGLAAGADALAAEARRFHLDEPTGLDLPAETRLMLVPDPKKIGADGRSAWTPGDTANLAIGQGSLRYSPLQAACAIASLARRESLTVPTLLRQPGRPPSGTRPPEPLGLADSDYAALIAGLQDVVRIGIGIEAQVPGVTVAGKSGTAQVKRKDGTTDVAWFVAFAPVERPQIAIAVALEGDQPGVEFTGAEFAAPIVREIAAAYFDKLPPR